MRRLVIAILVAAAIVAAVWMSWQSRPDPDSRSGDDSRWVSDHALWGRADDGTAQPPPWFGARDVAAQRIAGRVTFEGEPVEGARVVVSSLLDRAGITAPAEQRSGPDGAFDFGELRAATYLVGASAPDRTAAILRVDLADPTAAPPPDALELRLGRCAATVYGTVLDGSGGVVGHASVLRRQVIGARADAQGRYELCVPRLDEELRFSADGYGSVTLTVHARGRMRRDVALVPEGVVAGIVVRADDEQPVAGALIEAFPRDFGRDRPSQQRTTSGLDGRFRLNELAPGVYRLYARHDGMSTPVGVHALAEAGLQSRELVLRLEPTARLRGVVRSAGAPLAGATVAAVRESPLAHSGAGVTQKDGSFVVEQVPLGEIVFTVTGHEVRSPQSYAVDNAAEHSDIVVDVARLGAIRGRVTRAGVPVAAAEVCCGPITVKRTVLSDNDGRYAFEGLVAGDYDITAQTDEAFANPAKITLAAGEQRDDVNIELDLAGTITGDVVDQRGDPVEGATVKFVHDATGDLCETVTDADGAYRCGAMTGGGRYVARVFAAADTQSAFRPADGSAMPAVMLEDGTSVVDDVRVRVQREELSIAGRVVDADGGAVSDARVVALSAVAGAPPRFPTWAVLPSTVTDVDGEFSIGGLTTGNYAIQARSARGGEAVADAVPAGTEGVELVLLRPGAIEGRLVGFDDRPVVYANALEGSFLFEAGIVDGDRFDVVGLRPGRYIVNAQSTFEGQSAVVEVRPGETTAVELTSSGRASIRGRVLDFHTREPVVGTMCHAVTSADGFKGITNWDPRTAPKSDEQGVVVLDPAPAGRVIVDCVSSSFRHSAPAAEVTVAKGEHATVELISVPMQVDYPSTIGAGFPWNQVSPIFADVVEGGPAQSAGLRNGDLVVAVDGVSVDGVNGHGVQYLIEGRPAGKRVEVTVRRGAKTHNAKIRTEARTEW